MSIKNKHVFSVEKSRERRKEQERQGIKLQSEKSSVCRTAPVDITIGQRMFKDKDVLCVVLSCLLCAER